MMLTREEVEALVQEWMRVLSVMGANDKACERCKNIIRFPASQCYCGPEWDD